MTKQEVLSELLDLILQEPSEELDERLRFKLPNIASEVFTCDVAQINEKLSSDTSLLDKLYAFLESSPPLNPLLTSFFSKTFGILITRRPEQVRTRSCDRLSLLSSCYVRIGTATSTPVYRS